MKKKDNTVDEMTVFSPFVGALVHLISIFEAGNSGKVMYRL